MLRFLHPPPPPPLPPEQNAEFLSWYIKLPKVVPVLFTTEPGDAH